MEPEMKCLSVRQPWASMIARGEKTIEVRTWSTTYRGPLVICVSKSPRISYLPVGVALVVVDLIDVRPITQDDAAAACCVVDSSKEFAWILSSPCILSEPIPVSGRLGIFECAIATD
jgi:hypothetical protein